MAATNAKSLGRVTALYNFACSGRWAYANVRVGPAPTGYDAVIVLESVGSTWSVVDRATACANHLVPVSIYAPACATS